MIYKNKEHAVRIFQLFKEVWKERNLLFVEGRQAFIGVRNDLFDGAASIRRIIVPSKNAFFAYERILNAVKQNIADDTLVLISLGPTATVLAYDLAMEGVQAIDIGQLDNEYDWFLRGVLERIKIPGKCVAEVPGIFLRGVLERIKIPGKCVAEVPGGHEVSAIEDTEYIKQIVAQVE